MPSRRRLADARASRRLLLAAERQVDTAVLAAIDEWLTALRFAILRDLGGTAVTAAAYPHAPFVLDQAAQASWNTWRRALDRQVLPSVAIVFGEAFQQARRRDPLNSYRYQQQYLEDVADRLRIWPQGAFEDIRPELMEALAEAESIDDIRDRIGRVLNIDAKTRAIRAVIHEVEQRLDDPDLPANARQVLSARRRELWEAHDDSLGEWQWKARRIARTEAHGAVLAGKLASAKARQNLDPDVKLYKRWLATDDTRTRATHRVADGQVVPLGGKFRIGGFLLDHPADAITIAPHEVINCRCDLLIYDDDELQDELQGPDGSIGEIRPGGVRIGPDDPDDADRAIAAVAADEQRALPRLGRRGEDHGQAAPADPERVQLTDAREKLPPPDRAAIGHSGTDLTKLSDDQLLDEMQRANDTDNDALWDAADAEWQRRHDEPQAALPPPPDDPPPPDPPSLDDPDGGDDEWESRQDDLGIDTHGEHLEPHEVVFVERFQALGHQMQWIPKDTTHRPRRPTNDFRWLDHGGIEVEVKGTSAKYSNIKRRIRDAVRAAEAAGVVKENFIVDLGEKLLTPKLRHQLELYNVRNRDHPIARLWVMSRGILVAISLQSPET